MPEKLKKLFIKEYTGKKVPKKYQAKYGKRYSKKESEEIFYSWWNKKRKKGQTMGIAILSSIVIFIIGILTINFLLTSVTTARIGLSCSNVNSISDGTKLLCLIIDTNVIYFIWLVFSISLGAILMRMKL